ncbi:MAG: aminodeoxychorismate synthase component I [Nitrospinae bacterium]|nr:aminodeoxychorismate synthase component I [Nitrospinota bacterium]
MPHPRWGKWSFMMRSPRAVLKGAGEKFTLSENGGVKEITGDPFEILRGLISRENVQTGGAEHIPFTGGVAGFWGYELLRWTEPAAKVPPRHAAEGDIWLGFYDSLIAFDHQAGKLWLVVNEPDDGGVSKALDGLEQWIETSRNAGHHTGQETATSTTPVSGFTAESYALAVDKVRGYIERGDCYQANIAQRFAARTNKDPKKLYLALRKISPAPFAAYIDTGATQILSSSPERFITLRDGAAQARPIKGTRPRGKTSEEDARLAEELYNSEKERAENLMIVDLLRNDLSKVCAPESVKVSSLFEVEKFANVIHLTSTVEGTLKDNHSGIDLLRASFPCGSVTGAPKIRAMEIIGEIEPEARGVYCGAIGYMGHGGDMDLSVGIRLMTLSGGVASFYSGGGVTYPSNPLEEYEETLHKAKGIMEALEKA